MPDFLIPDTVQRKVRRSRRLAWVGVAASLAAAAFGVLRFVPAGPSVSRDTLVFASVERGVFHVRVQAPGTLQSRDPRFITAPDPGTVTSVLVQPGDAVRAGEILVRLNNPSLHAVLVAAQSNLADARATLISTGADLDNQRLSLESDLATSEAAAESAALRVQAEQGLESAHIIAELDYRDALLTAKTARLQAALTRLRIAAFRRNEQAQLSAQQVRVAACLSALAEAQANVAALSITAGASGIVQSVTAQLGQTLSLGDAVAQIDSLGDLKATLSVAPSDAGNVETGQHVSIQLNDAQGTIIEGVVSRVAPKVEDDSVAVDVRLAQKLPQGMRADLAVVGEIDVTTISQTLYVPLPANTQPDAPGYVYKLVPGSKLVRVPVQFGTASADAIQILSGLQAGDQIIVSDTSNFNNQAQVRLQ